MLGLLHSWNHIHQAGNGANLRTTTADVKVANKQLTPVSNIQRSVNNGNVIKDDSNEKALKEATINMVSANGYTANASANICVAADLNSRNGNVTVNNNTTNVISQDSPKSSGDSGLTK